MLIYILDLGLSCYQEALQLQRQLHAACHATHENVLVLTQHYPVVTLGYRRQRTQLQLSVAELAALGISVVEIERGGGATYHGPGQLVMYPIFSSLFRCCGVRGFVASLEEVMRRVSHRFGVTATRQPNLPGIWIGERKLGAVGVAVRRGVTLHGCALNVDLDLHPFAFIAPCGLSGKEVTSLKQERGVPIPLAEVVQETRRSFAAVFATSVKELPDDWCGIERAARTSAVGNDQSA